MAKGTHTQGPWTFGPGFNGRGSVGDASGESVAAIALRGAAPMFEDTATADANGRLIAAAPELLESARIDEVLFTQGYTLQAARSLGVEDEFGIHGGGWLRDYARDKRRAAIAKATGASQ